MIKFFYKNNIKTQTQICNKYKERKLKYEINKFSMNVIRTLLPFVLIINCGVDYFQGVAVDEERIEAINVLGDRLLKTPRDDMSDIATVKDKMGNLNNHWSAIQGSLRNHRDALGTALEVHAFNRDVEDLNDRINEKVGRWGCYWGYPSTPYPLPPSCK